jgi:UDP-N-acetylmuramate--alanine ligase
VDSQKLVAAIKSYGHKSARYIGDLSEIGPLLESELKGGDVVITMGAGNVWRAGEDLLQRLS